MNKQIKSAAYTLIFLLIYYWASKGIVKLLFNTNNEYRFDGRVKFINYSLVLFSLFYIIGIYHIVGPYHTESFYKYFIILNFIYLAVGNLFNSLITSNFKN
jgi:hypothetical protein